MADLTSTSPVETELLTTGHAAAFCGISPRSLIRWSKTGAAPKPIRLGYGTRTTIRYRRSDLIVWIKNGCCKIE